MSPKPKFVFKRIVFNESTTTTLQPPVASPPVQLENPNIPKWKPIVFDLKPKPKPATIPMKAKGRGVNVIDKLIALQKKDPARFYEQYKLIGKSKGNFHEAYVALAFNTFGVQPSGERYEANKKIYNPNGSTRFELDGRLNLWHVHEKEWCDVIVEVKSDLYHSDVAAVQLLKRLNEFEHAHIVLVLPTTEYDLTEPIANFKNEYPFLAEHPRLSIVTNVRQLTQFAFIA